MPDASSKAQQRFFFAAERRGDLPRGTAKRKAMSGPAFARLPERSPTKRSKSSRLSTRPLRSIKRRVARRSR